MPTNKDKMTCSLLEKPEKKDPKILADLLRKNLSRRKEKSIGEEV